jgi:hypothetical protein
MKLVKLQLVLFLLSLTVFTASAQNREAINKFMTTYSKSWDASCFGKQVPSYSFSEKYGRETMKGRNTLLLFWNVTDHNKQLMLSIDTLRNIGKFDAKLIGVAYSEPSVGESAAFWKANRMHFPGFYGKAAVKLAKALKAEKGVTAVLVDSEGTVCGKWMNVEKRDMNWVQTAIWALTATPDVMKPANVVKYFQQSNNYRALYVSEQLDEEKDFANVWSTKLICMSSVAFSHVLPYEKKIYAWNKQTNASDKAAYEKVLYFVLYTIAGPNMTKDVCDYNLPLCEELLQLNPDKYNKDYIFLDQYRSFLLIAGNKSKSLELLNRCIHLTEDKMKDDPGMKITVDYFKRQLVQYQ